MKETKVSCTTCAYFDKLTETTYACTWRRGDIFDKEHNNTIDLERGDMDIEYNEKIHTAMFCRRYMTPEEYEEYNS